MQQAEDTSGQEVRAEESQGELHEEIHEGELRFRRASV